jgi:hypothetical protein
VFTTQFTSIGAETARTVVIAYTKKQDAVLLAQCLENTKGVHGWKNYPIMGYDFMELFDLSKHVLQPAAAAAGPIDDLFLADLYVQTWDAFHLRDFVLENNLALLMCDANTSPSFACMGKIIIPEDDLPGCVENLTRIYDVQTMGNNLSNNDIYDE